MERVNPKVRVKGLYGEDPRAALE
jgi:hypothetical protein